MKPESTPADTGLGRRRIKSVSRGPRQGQVLSEIDSVTDSVIGIYLQTIPVEIGGFHHPFFICKITGDIERRVLASALKRKIVILDRSGTQQLFLPVCLLCLILDR